MERYERNRILRNFILKVIIVILLALLLIWLIPKITSNTKNNKAKSKRSIEQNEFFTTNLNDMKKVGTEYFKSNNLPSIVGDKKVLTLKEMYEKKLISTLTDSTGKKCDSDKSYVEVTKENEDYLMKVNLYCNKKEDSITTHIEGNNNNSDNKTVNAPNTASYANDNSSSNNVTYKEITITKTVPGEKQPSKKYLYEYKKKTIVKEAVYSNWSSWIEYTNNSIIPITCSNNDLTCLKEVKVKEENKYINGTYKIVKYYSTRTRTFVNKETNSYQWSSFDNINLLNNGYHYTGNWKVYYS